MAGGVEIRWGRLSSGVRNISGGLLDVLLPLRCLGCGRTGAFICDECVGTAPRLHAPYCQICANPGTTGVCSWCAEHTPAVDAVRAPFLYVRLSPVYQAITSLKYDGMRAVAPELAGHLYEYLLRNQTEFDVIVPVPGHRSRVRRRGYSQAELIGVHLAGSLRVPVRAETLERVTNAPSQLDTESREERWANVQGCFEARGVTAGQTVLLVDDLVTTGATASACADALKRAGARRVVCLSVARAP